jgi:hypothetical protein
MDRTTAKLIKTEFLAFAMKAFASLNKGKSLGNDRYLKLLAERLARVAAKKTKRLVVSLPPRHCKTFMGSICLPAWILAHNPSAKIIILTYGQDLADKNAYAIRDILRSDWFKQTFHTRIKKDRAKLVDFVTTDGGGVRALSIQGGVTGLGADVIIIDDPVEIKTATTPSGLSVSMTFLTTRSRPVWTIPKKVASWSLRIALAKTICPVTYCKRAAGSNSSCH